MNDVGLKIKSYINTFKRWKYRHYAILSICFIVWILFLSPNNIGSQSKLFKERKELRDIKGYYENEIEKNEKAINLFLRNLDYIETYGREQYLMKKDNEDIFLIIESSPKSESSSSNE